MITMEQFEQLELRIARILEARAHPNADKLLILKIDTGGAQKEIVAGIARTYQPSELANKLIVVVNNLQPAVIRGVTSQGMLLAAQGGDVLSLLIPDRSVAPGSSIH